MFRLAPALAMLCLVAAAGTIGAQEAAKPVKLITVTAEQSGVTRQFFGHVAARETVDLAFQVAGQIVEIPIVEGNALKRGALVARLDLEPFQLALDQARVQKAQADRTLERLQRLEGTAASQVSIQDAETQAQLAEIAVRNAERSLDNAELLAPFDALVAARMQANFATIAAGAPVARLHDMSELRVEIDVPEVLFQRADRDPDIALFATFPSSDMRYPLELREYNAETSAVGQTFRITLGLAPPEDLVVLPGASVTVHATLGARDARLIVPASAILQANDGTPQVMVFTPEGADEGTVARRAISIAPTGQGRVEVTEGLEPGQEIVASGAHLLSDGQRVRRFTGFGN